MAYSIKSKKNGTTYYLHTRLVHLLSGTNHRIYYFSHKNEGQTLDKVPKGYEVVENTISGVPLLQKIGSKNNAVFKTVLSSTANPEEHHPKK